MAKKGILFVISGPSGVGKTTVVNALLNEIPKTRLIRGITATTRPPRKHEINGDHYFFFEKDEFLKKIDGDEFLEYALVHGKYYYGSLKGTIIENLLKGVDVILTIDVQGFIQIETKNLNIKIVSVFICPKDVESLRERLILRGTEDGQEISNRILTAEQEIPLSKKYNHVIISGTCGEDFGKLLAIYKKESETT